MDPEIRDQAIWGRLARPGLSRAILGLLLFFGVGPALGLSAFFLASAFEDHQEYVRTMQMETSRYIAATLSATLEAVTGDVASAGRFMVMKGKTPLELKLTANAVLDWHAEFQEVTLMGLDGQVAARVARNHTYLGTAFGVFGDQEAVRRALQGETVLRPVYVSSEDGLPRLDLVVPVMGGLPTAQGVLHVSVSVARMWDLVSGHGLGPSREAYIVDGAGRLIAARDVATVLRGVDASGVQGVQDMFMGRSEPGEYPGLGGVSVIGVGTRVLSTGWGVMVETPVEIAYRDLRHLMIVSAGALSATVAAVVAFGILFSRRKILAPVRALRQEAGRVAAGDLERPVPVVGQGELAELSLAFGDMVTALRQSTVSRDFLNNILGTMSNALVVLDEGFCILAVNPAAGRLLGAAEASLAGRPGAGLFAVPDDENPCLGPGRERLLAEGRLRNLETRLRAADGRIVPAMVSASVHKSRSGQVGMVVLTAEDISERRRMENALRESEERLRSVVQNSPLGISIYAMEPDGRMVLELFNLAAERILGIKARDVVGQEVLDAFPGLADIHIRERLLQTARDGRSWQVREVCYDREPTSGWFDFDVFQPLPLRAAVFFADVSERVRSQQALQDSERKFRELFEQAGDGILIDAGGGYLDANPAALDMLGYDLEELKAMRAPDLVHPEEVAQRAITTVKDLGDSNRVVHVERRLRRRDGSWLQAGLSVKRMRGTANLLVMFRDISLRKRAEAELLRAAAESAAANKAKTEFLANMSHELRTPLHGIFGMLQLMQLTELDEEQNEYVEAALATGRSLMTIINDVLDFTKMEAGLLDVRQESFGIRQALDTVMNTFRIPLHEKGLDLSSEVDPAVPDLVVGDEARLRQILFNLVGNAVKFTESGQVRVEVTALPRVTADGAMRLLFTISDTGIGIPEEHLGRVFEAFTQVDGAQTRKYQGTGLGLGIVRKLVGLMGGNLSMESEAGQGTTVHFTLLVRSEKALGPAPAAVKAQGPGAGAGLRVLLAEDDAVNRMAAQGFLAKMGHQATCVGNGREVLEALARERFDCVLMDIQMPDMDGLKATRAIRSAASPNIDSRVPIIAMTAHAMSGDREAFLAAGMNDYVAKPVDMEELAGALARNMAARQADDPEAGQG